MGLEELRDLFSLHEDCPADLRHFVFARALQTDVIVWHRIQDFQHVSLRLLVGKLLQGVEGAPRVPRLFIPHELAVRTLSFDDTQLVVLHASEANAGAAGVVVAAAATGAGR